MGPRFTYTNSRDDNELIMECLDRAYASPVWFDTYPLSFLKEFPILHFDHAAIFYQTEPPPP